MPMSPDMEIVSSMKPDWILSPVSLISDLQPKYDAIQTNYAFLNLSSVPGMYKSIEELGALFDREEEAEALVKEFETFYESYRNKQKGKESPTVLVLMGLPGSYVVATENSYVGNLVKLAGGINVYPNETQDFINVNTEDMLERDPDIIVRTAHALPDMVMEMFAEEFKTNDVWKHFRAVKNERVYDLSYEKFGMSATFNYPEALEELDEIFYGEESTSE
jgi:iron complex transport system substrate-binding protein